MTIALKSIEGEAADCRAAWDAMPDAVAGVHIHHGEVADKLTEPIANRIDYILSDKPRAEQALRLRLMRPITAAAWAEYQRVTAAAWAEYGRVTAAAHPAVCPTADCPYANGSIFGGAA